MVPDLSISIIDTDNREQTLQCLRSVFANTHHAKLEVFVVDNACTDGSAEAIIAEFPQVKLIRNPVRQGFSTNNNLALSQATGRYLMLLNDDTVVLDRALDRLVAFMDEHLDVGAAGANLLNPDGTRQQAFDHPPQALYEALRPFSTWLRPLPSDPHRPCEVGAVCGACMLVRRQTVTQVGLLDTDFDPLYSEEVEWCHRIRQAGWKVFHVPQARVIHYGSQTMNRAPLHKLDMLYAKKALFFRKHHGPTALWAFKMGLFVCSLIKMLGWVLAYPLKRRLAADKLVAHGHIMVRSLFL